MIKKSLIIILLRITLINTYSQESLIGCDWNTQIAEYNYNKPVKKRYKSAYISTPVKPDTLSLPFFDDFSSTKIYPNSKKWSDKNVFINDGFAINPPSMGVATFDALNSQGEIYNIATALQFGADTLTSAPIDLKALAEDNVHLSFFYQAQGNGDAPEKNDSLVLQIMRIIPDTEPYDTLIITIDTLGTKRDSVIVFKSEKRNELRNIKAEEWTNLWSAKGDSARPFKLVILPIPATHLFKGFKFRFVNYASISSSVSLPGQISNGDIWNIDYVYLNKNREVTETLFNDVAFNTPIKSILKNYRNMPWSHFLASIAKERKNDITLSIANNSNDTLLNVPLVIKVEELNTLSSSTGPGIPVNPKGLNFKKTVTIPDLEFSSNITWAEIKITSILAPPYDTLNFFNNAADTLVHYQKFYNYFAYDDSTAEMGYGVTGESTANTFIVTKFNSYIEDSLVSVKVLFNRFLKPKVSTTSYSFNLVIWSDKNGKPDSIIYRSGSVYSASQLYSGIEGLNKFVEIKLDHSIWAPKVFHVGFQQTGTAFLNIGYDVNSPNNENIFYNLNNDLGWQESKITPKGALMIRPIMKTSTLTNTKSTVQVNTFPNPVTNNLYVNTPLPFNYTIYDINGLPVLTGYNQQQAINCSELKNGIYFIRAMHNSTLIHSGKIIVKK